MKTRTPFFCAVFGLAQNGKQGGCCTRIEASATAPFLFLSPVLGLPAAPL